ncbi:MAG: TonB-dependent receptor, partial [Bacteroidales bacterium]|nr:TonB-dependent receptor [Bacteroidales bacterium]
MKKNKLLLGCTILVVFLFTTNLHGQQINSYTISGVVKDMQSGTPLFYANVGLLNAADSVSVQGVSTDEHGRFKLSNIKQGDYIFQASYIGYDIYRQPISVAGNKKEIVMDTVLLQPVSTTLEGFTIYEKKPVYAIEGEKKLYNVSEDPSIQTGTTSDALQNAPGVEVDIEGNITLRGVSSVEIWINDKPSRLNAENLKTYIQQLPANSLERIEVISNPSARYSSSGGGVINIVTKSNIKRNSFISFGVNGSTRPSVSPWISYMFANEKFSFNIYMYSYLSEQRTTSDGYNITFNENMDTSAHRIYKSKSDYDFLNGGMYINGSYNFDTMNSISFWVGAYGNPHQKAYVFEDYYYREFLSDIGIYNYTIETNAKTIYVGGYGGISYRHDFNKDGHNLSVDLSGNFWIWNHSENYSRIYQTYADRNINKITTFRNGNGSPSIEINYKLPYSKNGKIELGVESGFAPAYDYWAIDTLLA